MTLEPITTASPHFAAVEALMARAFPPAERRLEDAFRRLTDEEPRFVCNALLHEGRFAGLLTYWRLERLTYVEHLATLPAVRGKGLGARALETLKAAAPGALVLEVEPPTDELTRRRIGFYRRNGFTLWADSPYRQPSYGPGRPPVDLLLMVCGDLDETTDFAEVRRRIHTGPYGLSAPLL